LTNIDNIEGFKCSTAHNKRLAKKRVQCLNEVLCPALQDSVLAESLLLRNPLLRQAMYQFIDNLNFKAGIATNSQDHLDTLTFAHYEFVRIHPFNNGNGRTGRILMNLVALKFGYRPLELYHREGDSRKIYIDAMKAADKGDFGPLTNLIGKELTTF